LLKAKLSRRSPLRLKKFLKKFFQAAVAASRQGAVGEGIMPRKKINFFF